MTALAPGSAQLVAGGRGLGRFALRVWLGLWVLAVCGAVALVFRRDIVVTVYTHPVTQWIASVLVLVLGVGWALLFLYAWRISRPGSMGPRKLPMAIVAIVLAAAVGAGSVHASALSRSQAQLFGQVFAGGGDTVAKNGRINVLLIGADAGAKTTGAACRHHHGGLDQRQRLAGPCCSASPVTCSTRVSPPWNQAGPAVPQRVCLPRSKLPASTRSTRWASNTRTSFPVPPTRV
ncbi:hypothetical protein [Propioniciclava flava]